MASINEVAKQAVVELGSTGTRQGVIGLYTGIEEVPSYSGLTSKCMLRHARRDEYGS